MIEILGMRKVMLGGILLVLNLCLGAFLYFYLSPQSVKSERELRALRGQVTEKTAKTDELRTQNGVIERQKEEYENLRAAGFFSEQNRLVAQRRIEEIQKFTHVLTAQYDVKPAQVNKTTPAAEFDHVVLDSPVNIKIDAIDDVDFYNLVYWLENSFPGHMALKSLSIERKLDVSEAVLRQIGNGTPTAMVTGEVLYDWQTVLPQSQVASYMDQAGQ